MSRAPPCRVCGRPLLSWHQECLAKQDAKRQREKAELRELIARGWAEIERRRAQRELRETVSPLTDDTPDDRARGRKHG